MRLGEERLGQRGGTVSVLEHRLDDLHTVLGRERRHGELGGVGLLQPRRPISRAVGAEDQDGCTGEPLHQRGEKLLRGGVDPVQVFDGEDERVLLTALEPELPQRRKGVRLQRVRADARQLRGSRLNPQQMQEIWSRPYRVPAPPPGAARAPSR